MNCRNSNAVELYIMLVLWLCELFLLEWIIVVIFSHDMYTHIVRSYIYELVTDFSIIFDANMYTMCEFINCVCKKHMNV